MISFVNFVNYTIGMITENKNKENQSRSTTKEDQNQSSQSAIYLRDDHCDWGSSGMNEFTNEFSENN